MQAETTRSESHSAPFEPNRKVARAGLFLVVTAVVACFLVLLVNAAWGNAPMSDSATFHAAPVGAVTQAR